MAGGGGGEIRKKKEISPTHYEREEEEKKSPTVQKRKMASPTFVEGKGGLELSASVRRGGKGKVYPLLPYARTQRGTQPHFIYGSDKKGGSFRPPKGGGVLVML